jgi:UDP-2,3-diacylglucosamine pyrophosphatase LpxH
MKRYILSDLHIGHKDAQYGVMYRTITYIRQEANAGDEICGLGDWFHMYENGFDHCLQHLITQKFRHLAGQILTKLLPGNHDHVLVKIPISF